MDKVEIKQEPGAKKRKYKHVVAEEEEENVDEILHAKHKKKMEKLKKENVFYIKFNEASLMKRILDGVKDMVTIGTMEVSEAGIDFSLVDTSHISMSVLKLIGGKFKEFLCNKNISLGLNFVSLSKILAISKPNSYLIMRMDKKNEDKIQLEMGIGEAEPEDQFELRLLNIDTETLVVPDNVEYDVHVLLLSEDFKKSVNNMKTIGENFEFNFVNNVFSLKITGEIGNATHIFPKDTKVKMREKKALSVFYAGKYVEHLTKSSGICKYVAVSITDQKILRLRYNIDNNLGFLQYFLPPKADNFDD